MSAAMAVPSVLDVPEMMKAVTYSAYGGGAEALEVINSHTCV